MIVAAVAVVTSCNRTTPDPVAQAIEAAAMKDAAGEYTFRITNLEKIDSTSFRTEIMRRKDLFALKQLAEEKLFQKYYQEGKRQNSENHRLAMEKAGQNLRFVESLEEKLAARLDETAYYDYVFSGYSETAEGRMTYDNVYVAITPAGEVLGMTSDRSDLHKGTGRVIPGYLEGISSESVGE